jgi:hypothetical protein
MRTMRINHYHPSELEEFAMHLNGNTSIVRALIFFAVKYIAMGFLLHVGWRLL